LSRKRTAAAVAALLLVGIALRLWVGAASRGKSFSDNAVVALMAMHALRGKFYAFYWGQAYMGSVEALVVAPFFALFGVGDLSLSAGLLPWYAWLAVTLYLVAERCGGAATGFFALVLCAISPPDVQFFEVTARGGYPATLAFGTTMLWLTLRLVYDPLSQRARALHWIALGGVGGLAFWTNWLVAPYFAVCAFYLLVGDPWCWLRWPALAAGIAFVLGSLPLWWFNWHHGFATFELTSVPDRPSLIDTARWALAIGIPNILGVRDLHGVWAFGWVGRVFAAAAAIGVVAGLWAQRACWCSLARLRVREASPTASFWLLSIATVAVYVVWLPSRFQIGRYLLPIASAAIPLVAIAVSSASARSRTAGAALLGALVLFYGALTVRLQHDFRTTTGRYTAGPIERLAAYLEKAGIRFGYAPYSEAAVTTYFTGERTVLADYEERYYPRDEMTPHDPALILVDGDAAPALHSLETTFSEARVASYRIFWPVRYDGVPRVPLSRDGWRVEANVASGNAPLLLDGDPWTYWNADMPGEGDESTASVPVVTLDLGREETVSGVHLALGERKKDGFRRLRIEASTDGEQWSVVKRAAWDFPVRLRSDGQIRVVPDDAQIVLFPPRRARWIRLVLESANPGHPWSIGEIAVFGVPPSPRVAFVDAEFADPASPSLRERRLWLESEQDTASTRALSALQRFYAERGDGERAKEVVALVARRFTPQTLVQCRFGRDLALVGYDVAEREPRALAITYYWRAERAMRSVYAMTGHFVGATYRFHDDYVLGTPTSATNAWQPGDIVKQTRIVRVPDDAPDGPYRLDIGVWAPATQTHLPVDWRGGEKRTLLHFDVAGTSVTLRPE
jgi:4-amino-4-deoxy-L-arabinose transferase-like glycosyltransferase